jgi:sialic acid synthase SpsE/mannose-6-phosphate isomerase-like protein (cupin superfamily)
MRFPPDFSLSGIGLAHENKPKVGLNGVMTKFNFDSISPETPLLILDMANNHNGSLEHGKRIIDEVASVSGLFDFQVAIKFQYRDLPNFIHPDFRERRDLKYVDRFLSTLMSWEEFLELKNYASSKGFLTACTPFDQFSVKKIIEHDFDILKIASASFTDWALLEAVQEWKGPIVASTAGVRVTDIDRVVSFFTKRAASFALMHCVAAYPTTDSDLQLNRIARLRDRYSEIPVGYSTHENPKNMLAAPLALAMGSVILERHVGSEANGATLNQYSSEVSILNEWIGSLKSAIKMLGASDSWSVSNQSEDDSLAGLRRYLFASRDLQKGHLISLEDVYFAIPGTPGGIQVNDFGKYQKFVLIADVKKGSAISSDNVTRESTESTILVIRNQILDMIKNSGVTVPQNSILEISHHLGLENFEKVGTCMITVVNREYCKKLLFLLPGQAHPPMFHKIKDETFFILWGEIELELDNVKTNLTVGDTAEIRPGVVHGMTSKFGSIIEEVSSTHSGSDSFYLNKEITDNQNRKTYVRYWL